MSKYGMYKKLNVTFSVVEGKETLPMLGNAMYKYSSASLENGVLKYYKQGFNLMKTSEFASKFKDAVRPATNYVLLLSLNSSLAPNNKDIVKTRNRVSKIIPVELLTVEDGRRVYTNVGLSVDPTALEHMNLSLSLYTGQGVLSVRTVEMRDYNECLDDMMKELESELNPIFERMGCMVLSSGGTIWSHDEGANGLIGFIERALTKTGIYRPEAEVWRIKLGQALIEGVSARTVKADEVTWDSPEDMEYAIKECGGDLDRAKEIRRGELRMRWLMDQCTLEERLVELTREEIENRDDMRRPNITLAMTDPEIEAYYRTEDKEELAELELKVIQRWADS